jgi:hypothetical protein
MNMESHKHKNETRVMIPSKKEAGEIDDEAFDRWMPRDF